ncbi:hypothetical protein A3Q56_03436 [Intoshia linei]|uniref:Uncharacterized protein n=1 Tax=Intoshia linei TaxID=1819745 RepID=A0A177B3U0_9BILA|nr:hypothetical protein A3Q56_03436 [Intoshia linei]
MSDIKRLDVTVMIREFLRDRQLTKSRTVFKNILNLLIENTYISSAESNFSSKLRKVQRFLSKNRYERGHRKGKQLYIHVNYARHDDSLYAPEMICIPTSPITLISTL